MRLEEFLKGIKLNEYGWNGSNNLIYYDFQYSKKKQIFNFQEGYIECNGRRQTGRTTDLLLMSLWAMLYRDEQISICYCSNQMRQYAEKSLFNICNNNYINCFYLPNDHCIHSNSKGKLSFLIHGHHQEKIRGSRDFVFYDNSCYEASSVKYFDEKEREELNNTLQQKIEECPIHKIYQEDCEYCLNEWEVDG